MGFNQLDLNLFKVFEVIYQERNLTRAAEVLSLSQPAVSNALSRLRSAFNDRLFVRTPQGMVPTPVAENIASRAQQALQLLNSCIQEGDVFKPEQSTKAFRFSMNDQSEASLLPLLIQQLNQQAPGITINSSFLIRAEVSKELASGALDFAVDIPVLHDDHLQQQFLSSDHYVCAVRPDHPILQSNLTLERYLKLGHIHVSSRRKGMGHADLALRALGRKRNIHLRVQHSLVAPKIVEQSDLACTLPAKVAKANGLVGLPLPFEVERLELYLYWHKNWENDQASIWLRDILKNISS